MINKHQCWEKEHHQFLIKQRQISSSWLIGPFHLLCATQSTFLTSNQYNSTEINAPFMKLLVLSFCWHSSREMYLFFFSFFLKKAVNYVIWQLNDILSAVCPHFCSQTQYGKRYATVLLHFCNQCGALYCTDYTSMCVQSITLRIAA